MSALSNQLIENKALMFGAAAIAFFVAAVLILLVFRLAFGRRLRMPGGRARQMRLGIVDAFDLDRQRQLVLVRRDNVEHLIMIGGPTDLLIESQILRTEARSRDKEARERDQNYATMTAVKSPPAEPKLTVVPPLAPEPQPAGVPEPIAPAAPEPIAPTARAPLPGLAPIGPGSRAPTPTAAPAPPLRRPPLSSPTPPVQKPLQTPPPANHEPAAETTPAGPPPATKPQPIQPGEPPAFMRWPARAPAPSTPPLRTTQKPPAPHPDQQPATAIPPEQPVGGPPVPSLEGLESLEEEMAKLLGRGPTKP